VLRTKRVHRSVRPTGSLAAASLACVLAGAAAAQSNTVPTLDVSLSTITNLRSKGRVGVYPNGTSGLAFTTTICNDGPVTVPWEEAMDPDHPFIAFLLVREDAERMVQISDYSFVKHGFFATAGSACTPCQGGDPVDGDFLGIGCSDVYTHNNNADRFWLGPAEEIDPWLGQWDPVCSHFDRGEPPVAGGAACDGVRSLSQLDVAAMDDVNHRIEVADQDLIATGSESFYYQAQYVVEGEAEAVRGDDLGSRGVNAVWLGNQWGFVNDGGLVLGSVLSRWDGASLDSATNGGDDGRVYVAVRVTGPVDGLYHYEYALHNRDNARGVGALRVPVCPGARVEGAGSRDVDGVAANAWSFARGAGEVVFGTADNPLRWNSIYNFWFDSDAAPVDGAGLVLDAFLAGPGADALTVGSRAPLGLYNVHLGPGCSTGTAPRLFAEGSPARASLGNASFALDASDLAPGAPVLLFLSGSDGAADLGGGCTWYLEPPGLLALGQLASAQGRASFPLPIPVDASLEGVRVSAQLVEADPAGALDGGLDLSNGLRVRVGDALPGCP